jgi:hypothetical protein
MKGHRMDKSSTQSQLLNYSENYKRKSTTRKSPTNPKTVAFKFKQKYKQLNAGPYNFKI